MPRQARKYLDTSFFHVIVQGINKEYIFKKERYMNEYLKLLKKHIKEFEIKIIAFCIMNNHTHILIKTDSIEQLSKFMQKVNSSYAKYYNYMEDERVGYVFRDRYKSEPILNRNQLIRCIKYIHRNPVKAGKTVTESDYKFSSYKYFCRNISNHKIFSREEMQFICNESIVCEDDFIDVESDFKKNIDESIEKFIKKERIKIFEIFENRDILKKLIRFLNKDEKIKYVRICERLDITKGTINRLK